MVNYASQESVIVIALISLIALLLAIYACSKVGLWEWKKNKRSKEQRDIDRYFEVMRWYNFKDHEIIDMLWDNNKSYEEMKQTILKANKERTGKI